MIIRLLIVVFALALFAIAAWRVVRILRGPASRRRLPREDRPDEIEDAEFAEAESDHGIESARGRPGRRKRR